MGLYKDFNPLSYKFLMINLYDDLAKKACGLGNLSL
jgi:hypothetical protein